jgi:hypothetical protein
MFVSVHKILIDPMTLEQELLIVVSKLTRAKQLLRLAVPDLKFSRHVKSSYYGLSTWNLYTKVPGGTPDIQKLLKIYPPKLLIDDFKWGYGFYLNQ